MKARALQMLAQRDQSRVEMRAKLLRHARHTSPEADPDDAVDPTGEIEALLDWLEANRYLSAERFVESRVHARAARFGNLRIRHELARHGLALSPEIASALSETEFQRACDVHARRFAALPGSAVERAAQSRFLAGRGFSADVIHRVMSRSSR